MILAVVGTGLLQISTNSKHNFIFLKEKSEFDRLASIAFIHNNQKFHHKNITLYDFIKDDYHDISDELRKYLKSVKVSYTDDEISTFNPLENETDESDQEENNPLQNNLNLTIVYNKITVSKDKNAAFAYKVYIPMGGK
jgi:hypothetical protein